MQIDRLDHFVLTVRDIDVTIGANDNRKLTTLN